MVRTNVLNSEQVITSNDPDGLELELVAHKSSRR